MTDITYGFNGWLPGEGIPELLKRFTNPIGVEIGSDYGWTTEYLLDTVENLQILCVDPYLGYVDWNGTVCTNFDRERVMREAMDRVSRFGDRSKLLRLLSDDAAGYIPDNSLDFVFIDGLHTYDQVLKDCHNYYPKLKSGGLLCGHDYGEIEAVRQAVDEFAQIENKEINHTKQDIWYWYKD